MSLNGSESAFFFNLVTNTKTTCGSPGYPGVGLSTCSLMIFHVEMDGR